MARRNGEGLMDEGKVTERRRREREAVFASVKINIWIWP